MSAARKIKKTSFKKKPVNKLVSISSYRHYNVVIVGGDELRKKVSPIEKKFSLDLIFTDLKNINSSINIKTIAVIVDEKMIPDNWLMVWREADVDSFLPKFPVGS